MIWTNSVGLLPVLLVEYSFICGMQSRPLLLKLNSEVIATAYGWKLALLSLLYSLCWLVVWPLLATSLDDSLIHWLPLAYSLCFLKSSPFIFVSLKESHPFFTLKESHSFFTIYIVRPYLAQA